MVLRMWDSSTAKALKLSSYVSKSQLSPSFSISRCFSSGIVKYADSLEWLNMKALLQPLASLTTDHAQDHLGKVVFVELPEENSSVSKEKSFGAVESVKATSEILISGEVVEVNKNLTESPALINSSPYEDGSMIKVKPSDPTELMYLMGPREYTKFCEEEDAVH